MVCTNIVSIILIFIKEMFVMIYLRKYVKLLIAPNLKLKNYALNIASKVSYTWIRYFNEYIFIHRITIFISKSAQSISLVHFYFPDCNVDGQQGNGEKRGSCEENKLCHSDGSCKQICKKCRKLFVQKKYWSQNKPQQHPQ